MRATIESAARNNAELCHAVLAAHGITGTFTETCWYSRDALPDLYPNLVTLRPDFDPRFLESLEVAGVWAVKDSFATLDLTLHGFSPIIDATWLCRPAASVPALNGDVIWEQVQSPADFSAWAALWSVGNSDLTRSPMISALLAQPTLRLLAGRHDGRIVAGCILNASADVVGLSNVFHVPEAPEDWLATCLAFVARDHPNLPIVDYETEDDIPFMLAHGFQRLGPLRIWLSAT